MVDLLIRGAEALQLRDETAEILADHDIAVRGSRISAIVPSGIIDPSRARTVIEAGGQLAMPGFINTHAHAPMVLWRGLGEDLNIESWFNDVIWQLEANLEAEDVYWGMQLGLLEMIEAGITAVADHYWHMEYAARAVEKAGDAGAAGAGDVRRQGHGADRRDGRFRQALAGRGRWKNTNDTGAPRALHLR